MIDSNLRQKSGNVLKRDESAREFVGDVAGDLLLEDEGREYGVGGGQRTNENNNNVPVKSVKEIRKF
jgi:hypothetical protein